MAFQGRWHTIRGAIEYDLTGESHEQHSTDGGPRTFTAIARVKADQAERFKAAVLPDVIEGSQDTGQQIDLGTIGTAMGDPTASDQIYYRQGLIRRYPEQHPIYKTAFVRDLVMIRGEGYAVKKPESHWLDYKTWNTQSESNDPGFVLFALTFQDQRVHNMFVNTKTISEDGLDRVVPDENADNGTLPDGITPNPDPIGSINLAGHSELERWCRVQMDTRGNHLQIKNGQNFYFVEDDGTLVRTVTGDATSRPVTVPDQATVIYTPSTSITVTWYMVPRVPLALMNLQAHVNGQSHDDMLQAVIKFPFEVFPQVWPDVDCLLYLNYRTMGPYYTYSGKPVYDIEMSLSHRLCGVDRNYRGWNATWCPQRRDYRRFVAGILSGVTLSNPTPLPITGGTDAQAVVPASKTGGTVTRYNLYEFAYLQNLWKFESSKVS